MKIQDLLARSVGSGLRYLGRPMGRYVPPSNAQRDFSPTEIEDYRSVKAFTMTGPERIVSLCRAIEYIITNNIPGDLVECGVWRGGSMMAVARVLLRHGQTHRNLFLFDTFEGMPKPLSLDVTFDNQSGLKIWEKSRTSDHNNKFCYASLNDVEAAMTSTGYPRDKLHFVKGKVEETIPREAPAQISLLRLDTDWYESTRHELEHLFPRLAKGGILIIDDYGCWKGSQKATDEYIQKAKIPLFLSRIDAEARLAIKL